MRYSPEHKQRTRDKILRAASKVFRRQGYHAAGVDKVMEDAGLTAGGFYAHFSSKESLFAEAFAFAVEDAARLNLADLENRSGREWITGFVDRYLSPDHRRMVMEGCPIPALAPEISRVGEGPRRAFEDALRDRIGRLAKHLADNPKLSQEDQALAIVALCVGGITLARAVSDDALADQILQACRTFALGAHVVPVPTPESSAQSGVRSESTHY